MAAAVWQERHHSHEKASLSIIKCLKDASHGPYNGEMGRSLKERDKKNKAERC